MKKLQSLLVVTLMCLLVLTACSDQRISETQASKEGLTFSNLVDEASQDEVREAMELAGIARENVNLFFQEVNEFNDTIDQKTLVKDGFTTIDSLEPEYDLIEMMDTWNAENPEFIGYNCRITTYELMKDSIKIAKPDMKNASWLIFDEDAIKNSPKELFSQGDYQGFQSLNAFIPTENTKDISIHVEKVQEDWESKEIAFPNKDKKSIISIFFHDEEEGYLFIGHMGVLIPTEEGKLLFIEKLSFQEPYQAIKFDNRSELNHYLMNKYDISWDQPAAKPFIMENDQLIEDFPD